MIEYNIGDVIGGADGGNIFGDETINGHFKYKSISIDGLINAQRIEKNSMSRKNSTRINSTLSAKLNGINFGLIKLDYEENVFPNGDGAYVGIYKHNHLGDNINVIDDTMVLRNGKEQGSKLIACGKKKSEWTTSVDVADIPDDYVIGTMMTNITNIKVLDTDGLPIPDTYYDNNMNEVNIADNPEAEQKGVLRMIFYKHEDYPELTGYYPSMIP